MNKKLSFFFLILIASFIYADVGERYTETEGGYSICPPLYWYIIEIPGFKYRIIYTDPINGFSPNINFINETFYGSLSQYIESANQNLKMVYPDLELMNGETFIINSGIIGYKQIFINSISGNLLRQFSYCFKSDDKVWIITCTVNNGNGSRFEPIFDESVKTFEFIRH